MNGTANAASRHGHDFPCAERTRAWTERAPTVRFPRDCVRIEEPSEIRQSRIERQVEGRLVLLNPVPQIGLGRRDALRGALERACRITTPSASSWDFAATIASVSWLQGGHPTAEALMGRALYCLLVGSKYLARGILCSPLNVSASGSREKRGSRSHLPACFRFGRCGRGPWETRRLYRGRGSSHSSPIVTDPLRSGPWLRIRPVPLSLRP